MWPRRVNPDDPVAESAGVPGEVGEDVLERLRRGDIAALEELYHFYGNRVFRVCLGILGNRDDAEDATQEVFLRVFEQSSKFSGRCLFSTWLLRLGANHTLNMVKAAGRRSRLSRPLANDLVCPAPAPEHSSIAAERRAAIVDLLQQLPAEQRQVVVLREMEGLSYADLAEVLGVPVGTVTSRLIRGRDKLRDLARDGGPADFFATD